MGSKARNIGAILLGLAESDPGAISVEHNAHCYSRADVIASASELSVFFKEQGVMRGASVAILATNPLRGIEAMIALWSLEAAVLFLDPRQTVVEVAATKERASIDLVFSDSRSFAERGNYRHIPSRGGVTPAAPILTFPAGSEDSDALILSSSGTTGFPRFRRRSHRAFVTDIHASARLMNVPTPKSAAILGSLAFGAILGHWIRLMMHGRFILSLPLFFRTVDLHHALSRTDIRTVGLPPVLIRDLLEFNVSRCPEADGPAYPNIERLSSIGGPIAPHDLVRAYQTLTPGVHNLYSLSGVGAVSNLSGEDVLWKQGSVGKPFKDVCVSIVDEEGNALPTGEIGRVIATSMWHPGATPVDSGDLGWIDEDGYLFLTGRAQQMACRNSINVNLNDLESDVKRLSGVRDCIAFSVRTENASDDRIYLAVEAQMEPDELRARIQSSVAAYRRPDKILVQTALPRNASDKIALGLLQSAVQDEESAFVKF